MHSLQLPEFRLQIVAGLALRMEVLTRSLSLPHLMMELELISCSFVLLKLKS